MLLPALFYGLTLVAFYTFLSNSYSIDGFNNWAVQYNKTYNPMERYHAYNNWLSNKELIKRHNRWSIDHMLELIFLLPFVAGIIAAFVPVGPGRIILLIASINYILK